MGGAHLEREDFARSAQRDAIDPFHMKMHFRVLVVASIEKVSVRWGNKEKNHSQNILGREAGTFGGGGGGGGELECLGGGGGGALPPPLDRTLPG